MSSAPMEILASRASLAFRGNALALWTPVELNCTGLVLVGWKQGIQSWFLKCSARMSLFNFDFSILVPGMTSPLRARYYV